MADVFDTEVYETIARLMPELTSEQLPAAVEAFLAYINIVDDVHDRLEAAEEACELTTRETGSTVEVGHVAPVNPSNSL